MLQTDEIQKLSKYVTKNDHETPYMVTDLSKVEQKCREFKKVFPSIDLYYAVKAFNEDEVIKHIDPLLDGYDVASLAEIKQLTNLGIKPARMTYSNPVKGEDSIREAVRIGVGSFAYQSVEELNKIRRCTEDKLKVYLRLKVSDETSELSFSSKFGCEPDEAVELLSAAKKMGFEPAGLTFHVGSQATFNGVWERALGRCQHIIKEVAQEGIKLQFINLGGGFPVQYESEHPSLEEVGQTVNSALTTYGDDFQGLTYLAEPGRFLVADSSTVVTTVIGAEKRGGTPWLFLDVGSFQSFVEIFEFEYFPYPVYSLRHLDADVAKVKKEKYVLTGPSCDSFDTLTTSIELPVNIKVGDKLLITMSGAYTTVYGSTFNGFVVPPRVFIKG